MLRSILAGLITVFTVATITFFLLRVVPGGPFDTEKALPEEVKKNIEEKYGLNLPVWKQYINYLRSVVKGDLGPSLKYKGQSVNDIIKDAFPVSFKLGIIALLISIATGIFAGFIEGRERSGSNIVSFAFSTGISLPSFGWAYILLFLLSYKTDFLPPALFEGWEYTVLPVLTLSILPSIHIGMLVSARLREEKNKLYVKFHKATGYNELKIMVKFILRNVLGPVISSLGPLTAYLITGSFVVEKVFAIPGLGKFFVTSVIDRDYTTTMGLTLIFATLLVLLNIISELMLSVIDPRERK